MSINGRNEYSTRQFILKSIGISPMGHGGDMPSLFYEWLGPGGAPCYDGQCEYHGRDSFWHTKTHSRFALCSQKLLHSLLQSLAESCTAGGLRWFTDSVRSVHNILALVNDLGNFFRQSAKRTVILLSVISDVCGSETSYSGGVSHCGQQDGSFMHGI